MYRYLKKKKKQVIGRSDLKGAKETDEERVEEYIWRERETPEKQF